MEVLLYIVMPYQNSNWCSSHTYLIWYYSCRLPKIPRASCAATQLVANYLVVNSLISFSFISRSGFSSYDSKSRSTLEHQREKALHSAASSINLLSIVCCTVKRQQQHHTKAMAVVISKFSIGNCRPSSLDWLEQSTAKAADRGLQRYHQRTLKCSHLFAQSRHKVTCIHLKLTKCCSEVLQFGVV